MILKSWFTKFKFLLFLFTSLYLAGALKAQGQTCGINSGIFVGGLIGGEQFYAPDTSSIQPGWICYQFEWVVNNVPESNQDTLLMFIPFGYNQICLTVYATNPATGDSCISEHCNIFYSTGNCVYPVLDIIVNGLTVDFSIGYYNNDAPFLTEDYWIYFGDGSPMEWGNASVTHTYASPGDYTIIAGAATDSWTLGNASGQIQQTIHVGTIPNLEANWSLIGNQLCDSVQVQASASQLPSGVEYYSESLTSNAVYLPNAGNGYLPTRPIPGHDYLSAQVWDGSSGSDWQHAVYGIQECGISPDTANGKVFMDLNFNGIPEPGEPGIAGMKITAKGSSIFPAYITTPTISPGGLATYDVYTDSAGDFRILMPHDDMLLGLTLTTGQVLTYPTGPAHQTNYDSSTVNYGPYNFGITNFSTQICGTTYMDDNQDSIYNSGTDRIFSAANIRCFNTTNGLEYNTMGGNYCLGLPPGNYELTPEYCWLDSASIVPDTIFVSGLAGGLHSNKDFGYNSPVQTNFHVTLTGDPQPRPGFDHSQGVLVFNSGALNSSGTVVITFDTIFSSVIFFTPGGVVDTINHTITWVTDSIPPGSAENYGANFTIPAATPLGTILNSYASITPMPGFTDNVISNNSDTIYQVVVGSYDPNDKVVHPAGLGASGIVMPGTRLTYHIRFQNTGTASAINVVVTDTIHQDMDVNTLMMHSSSHPYSTMTIEGRVITWTFYNIYLPDSTSNLEQSQGYVEFSISPVANLPEGTVVTNSANIYFDFNAPIITNQAITTFQTTGVGQSELTDAGYMKIFPQPAHDRCDLVLHDFPYGRSKIILVDLSGRLIKDFDLDINSKIFTIPIDLQSVSPGFYMINVTTEQNRVAEQLIKF